MRKTSHKSVTLRLAQSSRWCYNKQNILIRVTVAHVTRFLSYWFIHRSVDWLTHWPPFWNQNIPGTPGQHEYRADSRLAPSEWGTLLQSSAVSHWLGANLESALSIPGLLMPWLHVSPSHQQPWYWLCRITRSLSSTRWDFNHLCHIMFEKF